MAMARKSNRGLGHELFSLVAGLPWWVGVVLAIVAYMVLHRYAVAEVAPTLGGAAAVDHLVVGHLVKALATWGQYLLPLLFLSAAVVSAVGRKKRSGLVEAVARDDQGAALRTMRWDDFELMVGEAFRQRGFHVMETGGGGADGGIDLLLRKGQETFPVQCKHWRATKVSVSVVRELYGVMATLGAAGGFVVTSGDFTEDARDFAKGRHIELLDGHALKKMIDGVSKSRAAANSLPRVPASSAVASPLCPVCAGQMVKRIAQHGRQAGSAFWGCQAFPKCRGTRPFAADSSPS